MNLREEIQAFLRIKIHNELIDYQIIERQDFDFYERQLISYTGDEKDEIRAYLFIPRNQEIKGAVLVNHQHNGERHLGKSEVSGIAGDSFQYFCPELAKNGIVALAPDSICFEDRRENMSGTKADPNPDNDWLQHYNEMSYRLLQGKTLMEKVVNDSSRAISVLMSLEVVKTEKIGILGHSYGGNTVIFHSPFDDRIKYSCTSGAVCSYRTKFRFSTGIEMAEVIPGFTEKYDIEDLLKTICPRKLLILSSESDQYSRDAREIYEKVRITFQESGMENNIIHKEYKGGHKLDEKRFRDIIQWFITEMETE